MHSVGDALNNELALYGGDSNLLQAGNVSWYSDTSVPALYMDSKAIWWIQATFSFLSCAHDIV